MSPKFIAEALVQEKNNNNKKKGEGGGEILPCDLFLPAHPSFCASLGDAVGAFPRSEGAIL